MEFPAANILWLLPTFCWSSYVEGPNPTDSHMFKPNSQNPFSSFSLEEFFSSGSNLGLRFRTLSTHSSYSSWSTWKSYVKNYAQVWDRIDEAWKFCQWCQHYASRSWVATTKTWGLIKRSHGPFTGLLSSESLTLHLRTCNYVTLCKLPEFQWVQNYLHFSKNLMKFPI
jgi:hypothetical protein